MRRQGKARMRKALIGLLLAVIGLAAVVAYALYFDPRPPDTTAARVYAGDAHGVDFCDLPHLDGSGLTADEIPKAFTPSCGIRQWPAPILAGCTEPLPPEADDLRGLWRVESGRMGHIERIEQCGNRFIVVAEHTIHDFRTNGTLAEGANDINPVTCMRIRAAVRWSDDKVLEFRPWGLVNLVTRRLADQDTLIWEYPGQPTSTLKRICRLPS